MCVAILAINVCLKHLIFKENTARHYDTDADKPLAQPGRKQARKQVRDARYFNNIETRAVIKFFFSCKARCRRKFTPF